MSKEATVCWPAKHDVFGIGVSATCYDEVIRKVMEAAHRRQPALVDFMDVHSLVCANGDTEHGQRLNAFDLVAPDGQPVRWALNYFYSANLSDRVYGPELTFRLCRAAAGDGISVYLYGSEPAVLESLKQKLLEVFPTLKIVGAESPPFRALTAEEDAAVIERINASGAGIVLLGLGAPKQEVFAYEHRHSIQAVQLCVGAAFDLHAGTRKMAPAWMQRNGLEWLFRLCQEPGRLWKRYLIRNVRFVLLFAREAMRPKRRRIPAPPMTAPAQSLDPTCRAG